MGETIKIEILKSEFDFLSDLAVLMKTQKNKGTRFPLYCIYDKADENLTKFIECFFTEKEMSDYMTEYCEELVAPFTHIRSAACNNEISRIMKFIVSLDDLVLPEHTNDAY